MNPVRLLGGWLLLCGLAAGGAYFAMDEVDRRVDLVKYDLRAKVGLSSAQVQPPPAPTPTPNPPGGSAPPIVAPPPQPQPQPQPPVTHIPPGPAPVQPIAGGGGAAPGRSGQVQPPIGGGVTPPVSGGGNPPVNPPGGQVAPIPNAPPSIPTP